MSRNLLNKYIWLLETIERHIAEYGVSEFVVGQYGNFDRLVSRWHGAHSTTTATA